MVKKRYMVIATILGGACLLLICLLFFITANRSRVSLSVESAEEKNIYTNLFFEDKSEYFDVSVLVYKNNDVDSCILLVLDQNFETPNEFVDSVFADWKTGPYLGFYYKEKGPHSCFLADIVSLGESKYLIFLAQIGSSFQDFGKNKSALGEVAWTKNDFFNQRLDVIQQLGAMKLKFPNSTKKTPAAGK